MKLDSEDIKRREKLLISYYNEVIHYLKLFNLSEEIMEDIVQETFVQALISLPGLKDETKMKSWLFKIAKRTGIKYISEDRKIIINECSFDNSVVKSECKEGTICYTDFDEVFNKLDRKLAYEYLKKLTDREQKVLLLYYVYGHKLKDIAVILGESQSNIKSISRRAKLKLRKLLEEGDNHNER